MIIINNFVSKLDEMTFSYSSLSCYERCPYCFYLTYIEKVDRSQNAFSEYGSFCHKLLEKYFKNELMVFELLSEYEDKYNQNVVHDFPSNQYVDLAQNYYEQGKNYFKKFDGLPNYKVLDVEKEVKFNIDKYKIIGYIDLIAEDNEGNIHIIDHKSKDLNKPQKSKWNNYNTRRQMELYNYLRQLYIYSIPIIEKENIIPKYLNFNCFRKDKWVQVPFDINDYKESKQWALNIIKQIYNDSEMNKTYKNDWFCNVLCSVKEYCPNSNKYLGNVI